MKLKTALNKEFDIGWIGVATIDGVLRFALLNVSLTTAFSVFTNSAECTTLISNIDGIIQTFENYVVFKSIDINADGSITVALGRN